MILLNVVSKLIEVCVIGSLVTFVILFVSAWIIEVNLRNDRYME